MASLEGPDNTDPSVTTIDTDRLPHTISLGITEQPPRSLTCGREYQHRLMASTNDGTSQALSSRHIELRATRQNQPDPPPPPLVTQRISSPSSLDRQTVVLGSIAMISFFLAFIILATGLMARKGEEWTGTFLTLSSIWFVLLPIGMLVDSSGLEKTTIIRRLLWHLSSCIIMIFLFAWALHITSDDLPQFLPLAVNCGLSASCSIQSISRLDREILFGSLNKVLGNLCGCLQINFHSRRSDTRREEGHSESSIGLLPR